MRKSLTFLFSVLLTFSLFAQSSSLLNYGNANVSGVSEYSPLAPANYLTQPPNGVNGLFADANCALCGTGQQTVAANFLVATAGPADGITQLVIWGGYYPENIPNTTDNFTIILHSDAGGSPGGVLTTLSGLEADSRVATGVTLFGTDEYMFTFDLSASPMMLPGAGTYWLEIFNVSVESGNFYWETGDLDVTHGVTGSAWYTTTPATSWNLDGATELSLTLDGDDNVPVELTSFNASVTGNNVMLNWTTATESNNKGFRIERKSEGGSYEILGFVNGNGTSTQQHTYAYSDVKLNNGTYTYRIKQYDFDGQFAYSNEVTAVVDVPQTYSLQQNYPNPFNPSTKIDFSLAVDSKVTLKVYDILGSEVATLFTSNLAAGSHSINFDASNLESGVYFYRIQAEGVNGNSFASVKKMILMK